MEVSNMNSETPDSEQQSITTNDPRARTRVVGEDTPGEKKYQTLLGVYTIDGATIKEVLDVSYYYVPKNVRYGVVAHDSDGGTLIGNGWPGEFEFGLEKDDKERV